MTARERVVRAIEFRGPNRIPLWYWNRDRDRGDVLSFELFPYKGGTVNRSEWGYLWENLGDGTLGQTKKPVIPSWEALDTFVFPDPLRPGRFDGIEQFLEEAEDRYRAAEMGITGFNTYAFIRGFENALIDFLKEEEKAYLLLDRIFEFERAVIEKAAEYGFNGIHFADDWGTQKDLLISPSLWRKMFKPRCRARIDLVHALGMHVWFHCCGNITSIVPDFHEIGVDVMNLSQPNAVDIDAVGPKMRGKQCFIVPISYQAVSISGSPKEIAREAVRLYRALGDSVGGFIGYIEEYSVMGMSEENYRACVRAFSNLK